MDSKFQYTDDDIKAIKVWAQYPKAIHFGDPDVEKRNYASPEVTSARLELQKIGIFVQSVTRNDFFSRREITKVYLQKGIEVNQGTRTEDWLEAIKQARYPQREETSQATTPIAKPIHDWTSHPRTSMEYFFINIDLYANIEVEKPAWADRASDNARGSMSHSLTSRSALAHRRR